MRIDPAAFRKWMHDNGFLNMEIDTYLKARGDLADVATSKPFEAMITSRQRWVENLEAQGFDEYQIMMQVVRYYRQGKKRSPWDWLRQEYRPPLKVDYREYRKAAERRRSARQQTRALYGVGGRRTTKKS